MMIKKLKCTNVNKLVTIFQIPLIMSVWRQKVPGDWSSSKGWGHALNKFVLEDGTAKGNQIYP